MSALGRSLVFALKYTAEMERVCWTPKESGEDPDLTGLTDGKGIVRMATAVGDKACEEAAQFLELCAAKIDDYFRSLECLKIVRKSKRGTMKQKWYFQTTVERVPPTHGCWFCYGVSINDQLGVVVPYLWRSGGRPWEEAVMKVLGPRAHSRAGGGLVSDSGTVALGRIPILPVDLVGFEVDREPLVESVVQSFSAILNNDIEGVFHAVRMENEEEPPTTSDDLR
ncbi:MAG TPA: hypothetical protein VE988_30625 [Gemmataceae bacterium]|nr:hypothetical protein [Gemmataceae bacterium]